jgi:hypothetical protein
VLTTVSRSLFRPREDPASPADVRTIAIAGLRLPVRATIAIAVVVFLVIFDFNRTFIPDELIAYDRNPGMQRLQAIDRVVLFGIVPLLVLRFAFRDRPSRYGLTLGDWRAGATIALVGCAVMTPVVLWFATLPDAVGYYAPSYSSVADVGLTNALDLLSAEFLFRGFFMFTLPRARTPVDALRRAHLRLAGVANRFDPVGGGRPHVHPDPAHRRGRDERGRPSELGNRLGDRCQRFAARATSSSASTSIPWRLAAARILRAALLFAPGSSKSVWLKREIAFRTWLSSLSGRWRSPFLSIQANELSRSRSRSFVSSSAMVNLQSRPA